MRQLVETTPGKIGPARSPGVYRSLGEIPATSQPDQDFAGPDSYRYLRISGRWRRFVSLTEALDLTTPAGRAMLGLLAVFAAFEREILGGRTRA
jgi:hypothetical protein